MFPASKLSILAASIISALRVAGLLLFIACVSSSKAERPRTEQGDKPKKGDVAPSATDTSGGGQTPRTSSPGGPPAAAPAGASKPDSADQAQPLKVDVFAATHFYFNSGEDQARRREVEVNLPEGAGRFRRVTLATRLHCPAPDCDDWDRVGSLGVTLPDGTPIEIHRFVTAYGVGQRMSLDVTDFAPLLRGKLRFWADIDTWSGPARDGGRHGGGWLLDAQLEFVPGEPVRPVSKVLPLLARQYVTYGRGREPAVREGQIAVDGAGWQRARVLMYITGHGQGNSENCAEFCPKIHKLMIGSQQFSQRIWREDCADTETDGQQAGTYWYARAGWCPGAAVTPWVQEIAGRNNQQGMLAFRYEPESYINARDGGYDDQGHTLPQYLVSGVILVEP